VLILTKNRSLVKQKRWDAVIKGQVGCLNPTIY